MDKIIDNLDVRNTTKKTYIQLKNHFFKKIIPYNGDDPKIILDTGFVKIMSALGEHYKGKSSSAIRKNLDMLVHICKAMNYDELVNDFQEQVFNLNAEYVPVAHKREVSNWEDLVKKWRDYKSSEGADPLAWVIASFYILVPPRRSDYANLENVKSMRSATNNTVNYLVKNKKNYKLVFNHYKNSDIRGQVIFDVPEDLKKIIDTYPKEIEDMKNVDAYNLSMKLYKVFGKSIGTCELRRSFITNFFKVRRSRKEIEKMCKMMSHKQDSQNFYRED